MCHLVVCYQGLTFMFQIYTSFPGRIYSQIVFEHLHSLLPQLYEYHACLGRIVLQIEIEVIVPRNCNGVERREEKEEARKVVGVISNRKQFFHEIS